MQGGDRGLSLSPAGSLFYVCQMGEGFGFRQLSNFSRGKKKSKKLVSTPSQTRNNFFFNMSLSLPVKIVVVQQSPSCPPLLHQKGGTLQIWLLSRSTAVTSRCDSFSVTIDLSCENHLWGHNRTGGCSKLEKFIYRIICWYWNLWNWRKTTKTTQVIQLLIWNPKDLQNINSLYNLDLW